MYVVIIYTLLTMREKQKAFTDYNKHGTVAQPGRALNQIDIWRGHRFKSGQCRHGARELDIPLPAPFLFSPCI